MPTVPGFSQGTINIIKTKVSHLPDQEKLVTICMDEIALKTHLYYDIKADKIVGARRLWEWSTNKQGCNIWTSLSCPQHQWGMEATTWLCAGEWSMPKR